MRSDLVPCFLAVWSWAGDLPSLSAAKSSPVCVDNDVLTSYVQGT